MRTLTNLKTIAIGMLYIFVCSCEKEKTEVVDSNYITLFRTATDPTADYLLSVEDLMTGTISATGTGIEVGGWSYFATAGNTLFAIDYDNSIAKGYLLDSGQLVENGQFAFERLDCFGEGTNGTAVGIGAPWGGGSFNCKINIIDGASTSIIKSVNTPIYEPYHEGNQLNAWPTANWIQNNKLFVSFYPLVGTSWKTPMTDTAYVSVYSYPGLVYQYTFKDTRTGPIGYYASQPCVVEDESGNHYTFSSASISTGYTQSTKPAGILKINNGETTFDEDYFFNTEELGYKVLGGVYVGNGKVVARVLSTTVEANPAVVSWATFAVTEGPIHNMAVIDLFNKTIQVVNDIPLHGGQYKTPFLVEDGKVYASITTSSSDAYIYKIDPETVTATKGAKIQGAEIQAFYKY